MEQLSSRLKGFTLAVSNGQVIAAQTAASALRLEGFAVWSMRFRGGLTTAKGLAGVDPKAASDGGTPQKHAEAHFVAIGQRQLDRPSPTADVHARFNDGRLSEWPEEDRTSRYSSNRAFVKKAGSAFTLNGMDDKEHPRFVVR